jgi:hypothetical protein
MPQEYVPYPGDEKTVMDPSAPRCHNCTVHTGFWTSWRDTRLEVLPAVYGALSRYPNHAVMLVGHSLGGAVAAFAGLEMLARGMNPTVTTFGEPRVGNKALAEYINLRFGLSGNSTVPFNGRSYRRVTHVSDPVPLLPLDEWGYASHAGEVFISKTEVPPEREDIYHCIGDEDIQCSAGPQESGGSMLIPPRFRFWQLFFAHRDYFWRLGLCIPGTDHFWRGRLEQEVL